MADPNPVKRDTGVINRVFAYTKGNLTLNFTLRIDIKQELKDFLIMLAAAAEDVQAEIEKK